MKYSKISRPKKEKLEDCYKMYVCVRESVQREEHWCCWILREVMLGGGASVGLQKPPFWKWREGQSIQPVGFFMHNLQYLCARLCCLCFYKKLTGPSVWMVCSIVLIINTMHGKSCNLLLCCLFSRDTWVHFPFLSFPHPLFCTSAWSFPSSILFVSVTLALMHPFWWRLQILSFHLFLSFSFSFSLSLFQ